MDDFLPVGEIRAGLPPPARLAFDPLASRARGSVRMCITTCKFVSLFFWPERFQKDLNDLFLKELKST